MPLDYDFELRLAVFAHVAALRDKGDGLVRASDLNNGIMFQGSRVPIWNQQKGIFRPAVLRQPGAALTVQTSFKSPYDDRFTAEDDRLAYKYRGHDPYQADNIALRRAMELRRPILYLIGVQPGIYQPVFPVYVMADDPANLTFYLMADAEGRDIVAASEEDPAASAPLKAYRTGIVKTRLHQQRFRYLVLKAYQTQCSMCRLRHGSLLDAAHILPDRDERGKPEVPNGLALCKIHHSAYDSGILGIDPDYRIHLRHDILEEVDGPMLQHGLQEMHDHTIHVPRTKSHRPNPDYLAERFDRFQAA